jgi:hypothetical protein
MSERLRAGGFMGQKFQRRADYFKGVSYLTVVLHVFKVKHFLQL